MNAEGLLYTGLIPQDVTQILTSDEFISSLPQINEVSPVTGGVAHQVFQIRSGLDKFYLKIRGDRFASVPSIHCDPSDIYIEHQALQMFSQASPSNFPRVLAYNPDKHYLILTDALPNGTKMEDMFLSGNVTDGILFNYGQTLARVHAATASLTDSVRVNGGDDSYYSTVLGHRFGYRQDPVLSELALSLTGLGNRQLILGDASPKNIGVNNGGELFIFFDLETAHQGDAVFDYAYFLSHILIHTFKNPQLALANIENYQKGYGSHSYDDLLIKRIVLGIMLYRLRSIIPYPTQLNKEQTAKVEHNIESLLPVDLCRLEWSKIIEFMHHGQN